jgi:hypothetical protein
MDDDIEKKFDPKHQVSADPRTKVYRFALTVANCLYPHRVITTTIRRLARQRGHEKRSWSNSNLRPVNRWML